MAAVGTAVHVAAHQCVRAVSARGPLPTYETLYGASATFNALWHNSVRRRQALWRRPTEAPLYLEALYEAGPTREAFARAQVRLRRALAHLIGCEEVWSSVRAAAPDGVILVDPFYRFVVSDEVSRARIPCCAAPDLVVRPAPNAPWHIVDFKSGRADGVVDQVLTYALAARDGLGLSVTEGSRGVVVSLGSVSGAEISSFTIDSADLEHAAMRIRSGTAAARVLTEGGVGEVPPPFEALPGPMSEHACWSCAIRALCHPDRHPLDRRR